MDKRTRLPLASKKKPRVPSRIVHRNRAYTRGEIGVFSEDLAALRGRLFADLMRSGGFSPSRLVRDLIEKTAARSLHTSGSGFRAKLKKG